jgi:DNA-binding MarR family transcriptional regulator
MLNEVHLILGGAVAAAVSGVLGLVITGWEMRRARTGTEKVREQLAWERHDSPELTRNLLVLEMISDEIESTPVGVAVRARLTPNELNDAVADLLGAGLIEKPTSDLLRLTETGRDVLTSHKLELQESLLNRRRAMETRRPSQSLEDLDLAIADAVKSLRAKHA